MDCFNFVLTTFLCLDRGSCIAVYGGSESSRISPNYLNLCSKVQQRSYGFGITWESVINDRIFLFGWTIPLRCTHTRHGCLEPSVRDYTGTAKRTARVWHGAITLVKRTALWVKHARAQFKTPSVSTPSDVLVIYSLFSKDALKHDTGVTATENSALPSQA